MDTMIPPPPTPDLNHKQLKALAKAARPWYAKKRFWLLGIIAVFIIAGIASSSGKSGTTGKRLPAGSDQFPTATTAPAATPTTAAPVAKASSCDVVREALLTGTQAQIDAAMGQLQADKTADATAREYADYYLHRDQSDAQLRSMDVSLIRTACS